MGTLDLAFLYASTPEARRQEVVAKDVAGRCTKRGVAAAAAAAAAAATACDASRHTEKSMNIQVKVGDCMVSALPKDASESSPTRHRRPASITSSGRVEA